MHEQGYAYVGETAITRLTPFELDKLQLGHLVRQEQQERQANSAGDGHSAPKSMRRKRLREQRRNRSYQ